MALGEAEQIVGHDVEDRPLVYDTVRNQPTFD